MYVCMYMCVRVLSVCVYVFACVCLCLHVCICVWVCMCVCMWAYVYECMAMRSRERSKEKAQKTWSSASQQWRIGVEMSNRNFRQIYFDEFKLGRTAAQTVEISTKYGAREVSTNAQYNASVGADPHKTTRDIAKELSVHHTTIVRHLKQIGKTKKLDKWVPHELTEIQKNRRFEISSAHLLRNASDPFLERIVTCDEKWILYDNSRRSAQWLDQKKPQLVVIKC
uniref:HTH_48 domain-containing protein n=1 Tax=Haemonchus contortus TaxID=6289 RepID=A0A7I4Z248_HAECO